MRASKLAFFLRPQEFEKEQYESGTRSEQYISGYGKKTEQYISGYTQSKGVAYQFIDASKVLLKCVLANAAGRGSSTNDSYVTFRLSNSIDEDYKGNSFITNNPMLRNGVLALQNYKLRLKDAVVGGHKYIGATHYSLSPTTFKNVEFTMSEDLGAVNVSYTYTTYFSVSADRSGGYSVSGNGRLLSSSRGSNAYYAQAFFLRMITTPITNLKKIDNAGAMPIFSTREVDDTSKPIYSQRSVPVYDYRWKEISPK